MSGLLTVLGLACLPAFGNLAGTRWRPSRT